MVLQAGGAVPWLQRSLLGFLLLQLVSVFQDEIHNLIHEMRSRYHGIPHLS